MIIAKPYNFPEITRGDSFGNVDKSNGIVDVKPITFTVNFNLTGWKVRMWFRANGIKTTPDLDLSIENGKMVLEEASDISSRVSIPVFICKLNPATYQYDLEFTNPEGEVMTFVNGFLPVKNDVTK